MSLIEVNGLNSYYGDSHILFDVSLRVERNEVVALMGRNGAGKSTTLKSLMGVVTPRTGTVMFNGANIAGRKSHSIAQAGMQLVHEERRIFGSLTVEENLVLAGLTASSRWPLDRIYRMFPRLKERRSNFGNQLSGGEQQMLAIGRALTLNPKVLLLDEPTEGLAPIIVEELLRALGTITRAGGICSIIVEQNAQKILGLADRVVILERGTIVHDAPSAALKADPSVLERHLGVAGAAFHYDSWESEYAANQSPLPRRRGRQPPASAKDQGGPQPARQGRNLRRRRQGGRSRAVRQVQRPDRQGRWRRTARHEGRRPLRRGREVILPASCLPLSTEILE
jgi:branched-chain amino acid transport system ATP-binding protein